MTQVYWYMYLMGIEDGYAISLCVAMYLLYITSETKQGDKGLLVSVVLAVPFTLY